MVDTMTQSTSTSSLYGALLEAQKEFPNIAQRAENDFFSSKYATLTDLVNSTQEILHNHGLLISQLPAGTHEAPTLITKLAHPESGEWVEESMPLFLEKRGAQAQGSAITYARRYAYAAVLGVVVDRDDDGEAATDRSAPRPSDVRDSSHPETRRPPQPASSVAQRAQAASRPNAAPPAPVGDQNASGGFVPASEGQGRMIRRLFMVTKNDHGWSRDDWTAQISFATDGQTTDDRKLSKSQASTFIKNVKSLIGEEDSPAPQQAPSYEPDWDEGGLPF
jgi:hypothetical protein